MVNNLCFIIIFFLLNSFSAMASVQDSTAIVIDNNPVIERSFSDDLSKKYSGSEFDYDVAEGEAQNFLARAITWFLKKIGKLFGVEISPEAYEIIEFIVYFLVAVLILYLIIKLLLGHSSSSFFTRKTASINPLKVEDEHIEQIDLDKLIKDALSQRNFRLAVRFMYLKSLKELSLFNLIEWHFDKTNSDYYNEIKDEHIKNNFKKVSYLYDYVWYGEFDLDATAFDNAKQDFDRLTKHLRNAG